MTSSIEKSIQDPGLYDLLRSHKTEIMRGLHVHKIGEIQSFDSTKKTAEIQILFKRVLPDDSIESFPVLVDCPVVTIQGGGGSLAFPIVKGDQCLVMFSDRNIDAWFTNGAEAAPYDARCHDLSDGIAIVGLNALTSTLTAYEDDAVVLKYKEAALRLKDGKIAVENATKNLLTLINGLIDTLKGIQALDPVSGALPLTPASIADLEALKADFSALLY